MHSQPHGSTMWGLCQGAATPAYGLSQLVPGCPGARKVLLILPPSSLPSWCLPTCWNRATRATDARNAGTTLRKSTANRKGTGLLPCCVHTDPGEGLREAQGRGGKIKLGTGSFHLWFACLFGHLWGSPCVLQAEWCFHHQYECKFSSWTFLPLSDGDNSSGVYRLSWAVLPSLWRDLGPALQPHTWKFFPPSPQQNYRPSTMHNAVDNSEFFFTQIT